MSRIFRSLPTITESFILSFTFFLLSDIHQIIRRPDLENLVRVLTSLQLTANSPFDYPAFLFMALFLLNVLGIIWARMRPARRPDLEIKSIPIRPGPVTVDEAVSDRKDMADLMMERAKKAGIKGEVSIRSIAALAGDGANEFDYADLDGEITGVFPEISRVSAKIDSSPLTSVLLSFLTRIGMPIGGIYHPIQGKISLNPRLDPATRYYVYVHEAMHSFGLGEVVSEIGAIEVCLRVGHYRDLPLDLLGLYLLHRSVTGQLAFMGYPDEQNTGGLEYGGRGPGSYLLEKTRGRVERRIYLELKQNNLIRDRQGQS